MCKQVEEIRGKITASTDCGTGRPLTANPNMNVRWKWRQDVNHSMWFGGHGAKQSRSAFFRGHLQLWWLGGQEPRCGQREGEGKQWQFLGIGMKHWSFRRTKSGGAIKDASGWVCYLAAHYAELGETTKVRAWTLEHPNQLASHFQGRLLVGKSLEFDHSINLHKVISDTFREKHRWRAEII